jgi:hypothetical protein
MAFFYRNVISDFESVDSFEDVQPMSNPLNPDILEPLVVQMNQDFARDPVFYGWVRREWEKEMRGVIRVPLSWSS